VGAVVIGPTEAIFLRGEFEREQNRRALAIVNSPIADRVRRHLAQRAAAAAWGRDNLLRGRKARRRGAKARPRRGV
jgi:hypothetical protein